jgi:hypothetical protein
MPQASILENSVAVAIIYRLLMWILYRVDRKLAKTL